MRYSHRHEYTEDYMVLSPEWKMAVLVEEFEECREENKLEDTLLSHFFRAYLEQLAPHFSYCLTLPEDEKQFWFHKAFRVVGVLSEKTGSPDADIVIWHCLYNFRNFAEAFHEAKDRIENRSKKRFKYKVYAKNHPDKEFVYEAVTPQKAVLQHFKDNFEQGQWKEIGPFKVERGEPNNFLYYLRQNKDLELEVKRKEVEE